MLGWALGLVFVWVWVCPVGFGVLFFRGMRLVGLHLGSIVFSYWWYFIKLCLGFHYIVIFIQDSFLVKLFSYRVIKLKLIFEVLC